ncbi:hypothetical protein SRB5_71110 [Streptomyces sp. RB5]|uniref:Uncharacterized protein n=1 Tax=Streptomyces smaragdinus TaxID=2585196 RepID=A0A7K0CTZ5_9ACTN|nr:hypothetical protein [Streptomyces smaragdinus]
MHITLYSVVHSEEYADTALGVAHPVCRIETVPQLYFGRCSGQGMRRRPGLTLRHLILLASRLHHVLEETQSGAGCVVVELLVAGICGLRSRSHVPPHGSIGVGCTQLGAGQGIIWPHHVRNTGRRFRGIDVGCRSAHASSKQGRDQRRHSEPKHAHPELPPSTPHQPLTAPTFTSRNWILAERRSQGIPHRHSGGGINSERQARYRQRPRFPSPNQQTTAAARLRQQRLPHASESPLQKVNSRTHVPN